MSTLTAAPRAASPTPSRPKPGKAASPTESAATEHNAGASPPPDLASLRREIDGIDQSILQLIEQRLALADRIGHCKAASPTGALNLKPDREADVLTRLVRAAKPGSQRLTLAMWREIMAAGLARQGSVEVAVWAGSEAQTALDAARRRFGASPDYALYATPEEALEAAGTAGRVAVLALEARSPWWIELAASRRDLWIFDALDSPRGVQAPAMLAVGRIDPASLARGRTFVISRGGDAGFGAQQSRRLGYSEGWSLDMLDSDATLLEPDRDRGHAGSAPRFCLSAADAACAPSQAVAVS